MINVFTSINESTISNDWTNLKSPERLIPFIATLANGDKRNMGIYFDNYDVYLLSSGTEFTGSTPTSSWSVLQTLEYGYVRSWSLGDLGTDDDFYRLCFFVNKNCRAMRTNPINKIVFGNGFVLSKTSSPNSFFNEKYTNNNVYCGMDDYHHSHRSGFLNQPKTSKFTYRMGVELEIICNSSRDYDKVTSIESNIIFMEHDGSLACNGVECITIPLLVSDATNPNFWQPLTKILNKYATSWNESSTGLHIHVSREAFGDNDNKREETFGKMLYLYNNVLIDDSMNVKVFGRAVTYGRGLRHDNQDMIVEETKAMNTLGRDLIAIKPVRDKVIKAIKDKQYRDRYFDINFRNASTVEFRRGKGTINQYHIASMCEYVDLLIRYCKSAGWDKLTKECFMEYMKKHYRKTSCLERYIPELSSVNNEQ